MRTPLLLAVEEGLLGRPDWTVLGLVSAIVGAFLIAGQGWLRVKAELAERLIDRAFARHLADGHAHPPWSKAKSVTEQVTQVTQSGTASTS